MAADISRLSLEKSALPSRSMARSEETTSAAGRKKVVFKSMEKVKGRWINVLEGLELHTGVFTAAEQKEIVDCVYRFQEEGRKGMLRARTYSEPRKWMRGKGRVTIQFGCCYNYAVDKQGNPPGILRDEEVDPIPSTLKKMIKKMVESSILPTACIPNSCIVNIYDKDDCIPPHIDHHDFLRPFCTVSLLSECSILFGTELKVHGPGEFEGSAAIPLPVGSVLILQGNGADVAKHCVPAVHSQRISITFRKMDESKLPFKFTPDSDLSSLHRLPHPPKAVAIRQNENANPSKAASTQQHQSAGPPKNTVSVHQRQNAGAPKGVAVDRDLLRWTDDEFPPLGAPAARRPCR